MSLHFDGFADYSKEKWKTMITNRLKNFTFISAITISVLAASPCGAIPVTYTFTGTLQPLLDPETELALPGIDGGAPFNGYLSYDVESSEPFFGFYFVPAESLISVAGYEFFSPKGSFQVSVINDESPSGGDRMNFIALGGETFNPTPDLQVDIDDLVLSFRDPTGTVLQDDSLTDVDLSLFSDKEIVLNGLTTNFQTEQFHYYSFSGRIDALQKVPDQGTTAGMLALAIGGLVLMSRTRITRSV